LKGQIMSKFAVAASALVLAMSAGEAAAISRYNSPGLSCQRLHGILAAQGAAVLRYPSTRTKGLTLYDRYVRSEAYCDPHQIVERVTIPSADGECPVLHCIQAPDPCDDIMAPLCRD
jgi:hypothetical protein